MKTAVVCYSFTHNNLVLAGEILSRTGGTLITIEEKNPRSRWTIFLDLLFQRQPAIKDHLMTDGRFDHYVLVAPVWGGKIASPLRSFLRSHGSNMSSYSFISVCGGGQQQQAPLVKELTTLVGHPPVAVTQLPLKQVAPANVNLLKFHVDREDMDQYSSEIAAHLKAIGEVDVPVTV